MATGSRRREAQRVPADHGLRAPTVERRPAGRHRCGPRAGGRWRCDVHRTRRAGGRDPERAGRDSRSDGRRAGVAAAGARAAWPSPQRRPSSARKPGQDQANSAARVSGRADVERKRPVLIPPQAQRRRWLKPLRALHDGQSTPGCRGSASPPRASGSGWSAASWPGLTRWVARRQPGQVQPWLATHASTVRLASVRQAYERWTGCGAVRRKRPPKPGRCSCGGQKPLVDVVGFGTAYPARSSHGRPTCASLSSIGSTLSAATSTGEEPAERTYDRQRAARQLVTGDGS